jgi:hypothetical protein
VKSQELINAIFFLIPDAECSFTNGDLDTIVWHKPKTGHPTKDEILAAVEPAKAKAQADLDAAEAAKEAAKGKLTSLGLTADDLKALGL